MELRSERLDKAEPLRRRPKRLDEAPLVYRPGSAPGSVVTGGEGDGDEQGPPPPGRDGTTFTDEQGARRDLESLLLDEPPDPSVRRAARQIAERLSLRAQRNGPVRLRGGGIPESVPYAEDSDDIDIDRTVENLIERRVPEAEDIVVRTPLRSRRAVALLVDVSGSMKGEKARVAAATIAAVAGELMSEELTVIAFWKDTALLTEGRAPTDPMAVLDLLLRLPARGLTNVHAALELGARELARSSLRERTALLLSDCVHNAGPDPRLVVRSLPRLHVMLQTEGEHDLWLGRELARRGGGRLAPVRDARDVAPAINALLR